tara:strand:+ start:173 stop:445 length:273 start_codon:yes stop_codon:yes gene_type:complete
MFKYTAGVRRKMGFVTPLQVEHVIEYGKVIDIDVKSRGGGLRLCTSGKTKSVLKRFDFDDEIIYVRYKHRADYLIIIDIIVMYKGRNNTE